MSALLWALGVPVLIFIMVAPIEPLCAWSIRNGKWWATGVYVTVCATLAHVCLLGILFCGFMAISALSK